MTDNIESRAREFLDDGNADKLPTDWMGVYSNLSQMLAAFARECVEEARKKFDRELAGELRDPNGTIWECAKAEKERAEKAEAEVTRLLSLNASVAGENIKLREELARLKAENLRLIEDLEKQDDSSGITARLKTPAQPIEGERPCEHPQTCWCVPSWHSHHAICLPAKSEGGEGEGR